MTDHPDLIALRAAVLAAPDDDTPRLVFADWLEELGEPERAEFVRLQCEIARLPLDWRTLKRSQGETKELRMERRAALHERERELLNAHGYGWAGAAAEYIGPPRDWPDHFRRGFVAHVTCPLAAWLGEPCPVCRGGRYYGDPTGKDCIGCRGTGYVGGVAGKVCGSQPVETVTLSDREPAVFTLRVWDASGGYREGQQYRWLSDRDDGTNVAQSAVLPHVLWEKVAGPHPTRQAALDALSAACLRWARACAAHNG